MHHISERSFQVSPEQVGIRDIAELYLRTQENTEYLANIFRHQFGRKRQVFTLETPGVEIRSILNLIVQTSYLLYTCEHAKLSLLLSKDLFICHNKDSETEVVREFMLEGEFLLLDEERRKLIAATFYTINPFKYENAYAESVLRLNKEYLSAIEEYIQKNPQKKFKVDNIFTRKRKTFKTAIQIMSPLLNTGLSPKLLISCLEETEVFRTSSHLLKILNCSIYEAIRKTGKYKETLFQINHREMLLAQHHMMMYQENATDREYEMLENSIEELLKFFLKEGIIDIEVSFNSNSNDSKQGMKIGTSQVNKFNERSSMWKIKIIEKKFREFNQEMVEELEKGMSITQQTMDQPKGKSEIANYFLIEYFAKRNVISVKYISNVEINVENNDALMYHCNNMMLEWNNVSFEQAEKEQRTNSKKKEKCIAFKVVSYFNVKDSPFVNLLLLIDMAMIYGKVVEPELSRKVIKLQDFNRFVMVGNKINHLTQLFIKKIRRKYESTKNSPKSSSS